MIALVAIASALVTIAALFAAWRTWRSGYVEGYKAGRIDGIDLLAEQIASDVIHIPEV